MDRPGRQAARACNDADAISRSATDGEWMPAQWSDWLNVKNDMAPSFRGSPGGPIVVEGFIEGAGASQLF
jgi:hypothetical protein